MAKPLKAEANTPLALIQRSAGTSGIGLLLMAILAPVAHFGIFGRLIVEDSPSETLGNLIAAPGLFLLGGALLAMVAALDVAVAFSLRRFFLAAASRLVDAMSWLRVVYAGIFVGAISFLVIPTLEVLAGIRISSADVAASVTSYQTVWDAGLLLFGLHLILLGWLCYKTPYTPDFLMPLLMLAGIGYIVDSLGRLFIDEYDMSITAFTFIGEVMLLIWLLVKGRHVTLMV